MRTPWANRVAVFGLVVLIALWAIVVAPARPAAAEDDAVSIGDASVLENDLGGKVVTFERVRLAAAKSPPRGPVHTAPDRLATEGQA